MKSRFPICYWSSILGAIAYVTSAILAFALYPGPFSPRRNWLSDLGNQMDNPQGAVFYNGGVMLTALFLAIWFAGLSQWRIKDNTAHKRLLFISQSTGIFAAFALFMSAVFPINMLQVHAFWSKAHFMFFGISFGFSVASLRYHIKFTKRNLFLGICTAVMPSLMFAFGEAFWLEWVAVGCIIIYMVSVGIASLPLLVQRSPLIGHTPT